MDAREGRYGCTRGPIMGFESRAISARVTKQIVTIFSKTCDKRFYIFTSENIKYTIYINNIFLYFTSLYIIY